MTSTVAQHLRRSLDVGDVEPQHGGVLGTGFVLRRHAFALDHQVAVAEAEDDEVALVLEQRQLDDVAVEMHRRVVVLDEQDDAVAKNPVAHGSFLRKPARSAVT